jgi:copper chaperone CopZ
VRAAVAALPGVGKVEYDPQLDLFSLEYDPGRLSLADVFAAVVHGGKKMGQEYRPRVIG